jgi:hypothetical protein
MPFSAIMPDLHHVSDTNVNYFVRRKLLANNYFVSATLFAVFLKYFLRMHQSINHLINQQFNYLFGQQNTVFEYEGSLGGIKE